MGIEMWGLIECSVACQAKEPAVPPGHNAVRTAYVIAMGSVVDRRAASTVSKIKNFILLELFSQNFWSSKRYKALLKYVSKIKK